MGIQWPSRSVCVGLLSTILKTTMSKHALLNGCEELEKCGNIPSARYWNCQIPYFSKDNLQMRVEEVDEYIRQHLVYVQPMNSFTRVRDILHLCYFDYRGRPVDQSVNSPADIGKVVVSIETLLKQNISGKGVTFSECIKRLTLADVYGVFKKVNLILKLESESKNGRESVKTHPFKCENSASTSSITR